MYNILIAEADRAWNNGIARVLKRENCLLYQAFELQRARELLRDQTMQLVILGLCFPNEDIFQFLRELKENYGVPAVILSAGNPDRDSASGADAAAVMMSLSLAALRTRIDAQLHKAAGRSLQVYQSGEYYFSFYKMEFSKGDRRVELSRAEQKLLQLLVENRGFTLPGSELLEQIRTQGLRCADEELLSETITRLRGKLEDNPEAPRYIKTVCGIGYTWADGREYRGYSR